jgi:hypothetical protein
MLEDGHYSIIEMIIGRKTLFPTVLLWGLLLVPAEALAMPFFKEDKKFLGGVFVGQCRCPSYRICAAGPRTVIIDGAALFRDKDAAGLAVINHGQIETGENVVPFLFDNDLFFQKGGGLESSSFFQPEDIVRCQGKIQLPAAMGETRDIRAAEKGKVGVCINPFKICRRQWLLHIDLMYEGPIVIFFPKVSGSDWQQKLMNMLR